MFRSRHGFVVVNTDLGATLPNLPQERLLNYCLLSFLVMFDYSILFLKIKIIIYFSIIYLPLKNKS
jgi:hypothetical protein